METKEYVQSSMSCRDQYFGWGLAENNYEGFIMTPVWNLYGWQCLDGH